MNPQRSWDETDLHRYNNRKISVNPFDLWSNLGSVFLPLKHQNLFHVRMQTQ